MKIVQISDLHVGSQFLQEKFDVLVKEGPMPSPFITAVFLLNTQIFLDVYYLILSYIREFSLLVFHRENLIDDKI